MKVTNSSPIEIMKQGMVILYINSLSAKPVVNKAPVVSVTMKSRTSILFM